MAGQADALISNIRCDSLEVLCCVCVCLAIGLLWCVVMENTSSTQPWLCGIRALVQPRSLCGELTLQSKFIISHRVSLVDWCL